MGKPDWQGDGKTTILIIAGLDGDDAGSFEKRGWLKPVKAEEDELMKQHQRPMAPKRLQSAIPAVLKKLEKTYKAPAHITANDHPANWNSASNRNSGASWDPVGRHHQPSNQDSGISQYTDSVRTHHGVSLAHPEPSAPPNTRTYNSARSNWMTTGSSVPSIDFAATGAAYNGRSGPPHSHDNKRASVISSSSLEGTAIPEDLKEHSHDGNNGVTYQSLASMAKGKMTDGSYDHTARRNGIDHGHGTGTGVWLETSGSRGAEEGRSGTAVASGSGSSPPPPPPSKSVPKLKETFPVLAVPSQAVSTSSFSPSPTPQ
ncbi:hypothetical protein B0T09DRAFT_357250 [Sordaria sp. MPI-SDFR-AT-0083]|nr:hypothetical protein B0T09DRAFT_357250 [Sordaria sp. MPI-SDFR-AT-0083]